MILKFEVQFYLKNRIEFEDNLPGPSVKCWTLDPG